MDAQISFGTKAVDAAFALKSALLVYESGGTFAATVHDVVLHYGRPVIQPGQPITISSIERLMRELGRQSSVAFIPDHVVSVGIGSLAWWCPAGRRRIWFKPAEKDKELKALNGKFVHHPPLLFAAGARGGDGLSVWALTENRRPREDTRLRVAPYWNLDGQGGMCRGNIHLPEATTDSLAAFEKAFFNSAFTHSTSGSAITRHPRGHTGLWAELAARKTPPDARYWKTNLVQTSRTVGNLFKS
jgi:PRTRC genetic system protein B